MDNFVGVVELVFGFSYASIRLLAFAYISNL